MSERYEVSGPFVYDSQTGALVKPEFIAATMNEHLDALSSLDFYKRRCELLQEYQKYMRDGERTMVCDILANGRLMGPPDGQRYAPQQEYRAYNAALAREITELYVHPQPTSGE